MYRYMHEMDRPIEALATPEQTRDLLDWANDVFSKYPSFNISFEIEALPPTLTEQLPVCDENAIYVQYFLCVTKESNDKEEDLLATISLGRTEWFDEYNQASSITSSINYQLRCQEPVIFSDSIIDIERRLDAQKQSAEIARQASEAFEEDPEAALAQLDEEMEAQIENQAAERLVGLLTVSYDEASEILPLCRSLAP
jgi:hypothetical protein